MRLHFSIGCYDCRRTHDFVKVSNSSEFKSFCWSYASTLRSPQQILVPQVEGLMAQVGTYFPKVRRMLLCFSPIILTHFSPASTLLSGHLALATLSPPETDPQILERWCYADEVHPGQINPSEGFWSRIWVWRAIAFVNFTRWIGFRMSELFRKIDELRRLHILKDATQLSCIWWVTQQRVSPFYNGAHSFST